MTRPTTLDTRREAARARLGALMAQGAGTAPAGSPIAVEAVEWLEAARAHDHRAADIAYGRLALLLTRAGRREEARQVAEAPDMGQGLPSFTA